MSSDQNGLPPAGNLSIILLDIYFSILDQEFTRAYPDLPYYRFFNEIFIIFPCNHLEENNIEKDLLDAFLMEVSLEGDVSILTPGSGSTQCRDGKKIWIKKIGLIKIRNTES